MANETISVAVVGASGTTGQSIVDGLFGLPDHHFKIIALTRPKSLHTPANIELRKKGVQVIPADLRGPQTELVKILSGIDVVISAIFYGSLADEMPLSTAAKAAGVKRFVQSAYNIPAPLRGVINLRDQKEVILSHINALKLPYTYIDVGWWYHVVLPRIPSGRTEHALPCEIPTLPIAGDGNVPSAVTHIKDIGRYIAKIVTDPRTLNKKVFAYSELHTFKDLYTLVEQVSGEKPVSQYVSNEWVIDWVQAARDAHTLQPSNIALGILSLRELFIASYVHGYNTREFAEYMGYLDVKTLYPDFEFRPYEDYVKGVLEQSSK